MKNNCFFDTAQDFILEKKSDHCSKYNFSVNEQENYYALSFDDMVINSQQVKIIKELMKIFNQLGIKKEHKTLIIGLGNSSVMADSLGPQVVNKLIATNHYQDFLTIPKVALFIPEVVGKTGISSYQLIKMLVENIKPHHLIIIDALMTTEKKFLNNLIEVTSTGIIPGSILYENREINANTFGIPVYAIGVPLVINVDNNYYTAVNIEEIIKRNSEIIAQALNNYLLQ